MSVTPKMAETGLDVLLESGSLGGEIETSGDTFLVEEVCATL
jgi:hypothetical protein